MLATKVETPRSVLLPRHTAGVVEVEVEPVTQAQVEPVVASGQRGRLPVLQQHTALVAAVAAHQQA